MMNMFDAAILAWEINHPFAYGFIMGMAALAFVWGVVEIHKANKASARRAELAHAHARAMRRAAIKANGGL